MGRFRWGPVGPGAIADRFAEAVQTLPDMAPAPQAGTDPASLLADPGVDAVHVAAPHAAHAAFVEACIEAGKPVRCEKPLVATAAQGERVVGLARARGRFVMEALWTWMLPLSAAPFVPASRLRDLHAAGGALLDIGVYPPTLARWALETAPGTCPAVLRSDVDGRLAPGGVDARVSAALHFDGGAVAQFVGGPDFVGDDGARRLGEHGAMVIDAPFWEATRARLLRPCRPDESLALAPWLDAARRRVCVVYPFD
jgi:predicted dehydrogenase